MSSIEGVDKSTEAVVAESQKKWDAWKAAELAKAKAEGRDAISILNFHPTPGDIAAAHDPILGDEAPVGSKDFVNESSQN